LPRSLSRTARRNAASGADPRHQRGSRSRHRAANVHGGVGLGAQFDLVSRPDFDAKSYVPRHHV
jgi:hypothetical protein